MRRRTPTTAIKTDKMPINQRHRSFRTTSHKYTHTHTHALARVSARVCRSDARTRACARTARTRAEPSDCGVNTVIGCTLHTLHTQAASQRDDINDQTIETMRQRTHREGGGHCIANNTTTNTPTSECISSWLTGGGVVAMRAR